MIFWYEILTYETDKACGNSFLMLTISVKSLSVIATLTCSHLRFYLLMICRKLTIEILVS